MNKPLRGKEPTEEDHFYLEWGWETVKKNLEIAQAVLTQLLTLNTALLGSSVIFLNQSSIGRGYLAAAVTCFFLGLAISFLGIFPHASTVSMISPDEIKEHKKAALSKKSKFMWAAGGFTGAGLLVVSIGALCA